MANLDDLNSIRRLDPNSMLTNINELPDQVEDAWQKVRDFAVPSHYIKHDHILITGSGSTAVAGEIVKDLVEQTAKVPIIIHRDAYLPGFVDGKSLLIGVSYSGSNRQLLPVFEQAARKGAKLLGISTGGTLESLTKKYPSPFFKIAYGARPRAAIGYFFTILLGLMTKFGHFEVTNDEVHQAVELMRAQQQKLKPESDFHNNLAKQIASRVGERIPLVIASGRLKSVARRYKQQFDLNSKLMAIYDELPEASHNTLISLGENKDFANKLFVIVLQSVLAEKFEQSYDKILFEVLEKQKIEYESILIPTNHNQVAEVLLLIQLCDYITFYLAISRGTDPEKSDILEYIQERLQQMG